MSFFARSEKKPFKRMHVMVLTVHYLDMTCTVLLHCPISAEIRTVDSQSDLRILLYRVMIIIKMQYSLPRVIYTIQTIRILSQHKRQAEQDIIFLFYIHVQYVQMVYCNFCIQNEMN